MFRVVCLPMSYRRRKTVIHQYINNGYYIVLDVNSGSVHSVDPLLYDVISFLSERIPDSEKPFQIAQSLKDETAAALKRNTARKRSERRLRTFRSSSIRKNSLPLTFTKTSLWISRSARRLSRHSACISRMTATLPVSTALQKRASIMDAER